MSRNNPFPTQFLVRLRWSSFRKRLKRCKGRKKGAKTLGRQRPISEQHPYNGTREAGPGSPRTAPRRALITPGHSNRHTSVPETSSVTSYANCRSLGLPDCCSLDRALPSGYPHCRRVSRTGVHNASHRCILVALLIPRSPPVNLTLARRWREPFALANCLAVAAAVVAGPAMRPLELISPPSS